MTTHITYCRNCVAMCGLKVSIEDGVVTDIKGDKQHPISQGYYCIKGMATRDFHNGEDRLLRSLRRNPAGLFDPVDAEVAMDEIHARLSDIIARHGPESVALYFGTGVTFNVLSVPAAKAWMDAIGSPYLFSSMTLDQSAKWVAAGRMGMFLTGKHKLPDADVVMIIGSNPAQSNSGYGLPASNPIKHLKAAREAGAKVIVVDPRRTEFAAAADLHLPVRPGEDATLFAGLIRIVLEEGLADDAFCSRFTKARDQLRAAVAPFIPDHVARRTGIDIALLHDAARLFATARRKSAFSGTGPNMARHSNIAEHLIEAFNAICGGYRRAGDRVRNTGYFAKEPVREAVMPPYRSWEAGPKLHSADIGPMFGEYPTSRLPSEIAGKNGSIRALIQLGGNLAKALPEPDRSIPLLRDLDLLVSVDVRETTTGRLADYQIATSAPYEHNDFNVGLDLAFPDTFAQVTPPLLERPPGLIDDWQFFHGLMRRMGRTMRMRRPVFWVSYRDTPGPELEISDETTTEDVVRWLADGGRSSYEELRAHPHGIHFQDAESIVAPAKDDDGIRLDLCPPDVEAEIGAVFKVSDEDPDYPYRVLPRRMIEVMNSAYMNAEHTRRRYPSNPIFMNQDDMTDMAITDGDMVQLTSKSGGVVVGPARRDGGLQPGIISLSHGWGNPELPADRDTDAFSGRLMSLEEDLETINFMPRLSAVPVAVRRVSKATESG